METDKENTNRKRTAKKTRLWIFTGFLIVITVVSFYLYNNFNRLLSEALIKSFNSSSISDVYELRFEKLNVNLFRGDIKVYNVELHPREKPLKYYPYINTSFSLKTHKILLTNVEISTLLKSNILKLEKVEITEPDVELLITDNIPILFPLKDSTSTLDKEKKSDKNSIEAFSLNAFELIDASFHVLNLAKQREFSIKKLNISLKDLLIDQQPGMDLISYNHVELSISEGTGKIQKGAIKYISFKDYKIAIDTLQIQKSIDTLIFHFADFNTGIKAVDMQTADSVFHLTMESFNLSYKDKSIKLNNISFKPNISNSAIQSRYKYQHTQFAATVGTLSINNLDFDSLIYRGKIFIDEIVADKVTADIYKDNTKPVDVNHLPTYFGQQLSALKVPLKINNIKATNVNLVNTERKPDGSYGKAHINRGTVIVKDITNQRKDKTLTLNADAFIENKAHVNLTLAFNYNKPEFSINGKVDKFNLPDLNPLMQSYVPAKIHKGIADEISFSGMIYHTNSTGTMKFLYHDLDVEVALVEKAKWKSSVLGFAANTAVNSSNPGSSDIPPRIVKYHVDRNMNKGFINIIIKSVLTGIKETMMMSKENRKAYKTAKKKVKQENKK